MNPNAVQQSMTVTATRSEVSVGALSNTIAVLSAEQLQNYPALTLDEQLRQHAGFELFRRSSGWVQNPTSQGISLAGGWDRRRRGRTLVLIGMGLRWPMIRLGDGCIGTRFRRGALDAGDDCYGRRVGFVWIECAGGRD